MAAELTIGLVVQKELQMSKSLLTAVDHSDVEASPGASSKSRSRVEAGAAFPADRRPSDPHRSPEATGARGRDHRHVGFGAHARRRRDTWSRSTSAPTIPPSLRRSNLRSTLRLRTCASSTASAGETAALTSRGSWPTSRHTLTIRRSGVPASQRSRRARAVGGAPVVAGGDSPDVFSELGAVVPAV